MRPNRVVIGTSSTQAREIGLSGGPEKPPIVPESRGRRVRGSMAAPRTELVSTTKSAPASIAAAAITTMSDALGESLAPIGIVTAFRTAPTTAAVAPGWRGW